MSYRKRLTRDLDRWIGAGLVPAGNRAAILGDIGPEPARWSASGAVAILGAALLAFAAISFVAANWAELPRLVRFAVILGALWASYGGAALAFARRNDTIGHALALLGAALFGAAIALTAQTFNMSAFRNTGVLIWAAGALVTAVLIPSRPVLILAALVGGLWAASESANPLVPGAAWGYAALWTVTLAAALTLRSRVAVHLLAIAAIVWTGWTLFETTRPALDVTDRAAVFALIAACAAMIAAAFRDRGGYGAGTLGAWFGAAALVAAFGLQSAGFGLGGGEAGPGTLYYMLGGTPLAIFALAALVRTLRGDLGVLSAIAFVMAASAAFAMPIAFGFADESATVSLELAAGVAVFAAAAALVFAGARPGRGAVGILGVVLFVAQTLYVYGRLFGDLLSTAVFFLVGGLVLLAVSVLIGRLAERLGRAGDSHGETGA
ncbi:MAG: DUF2157 domain-containing protein [Oceanicaulis sp.]